MSWGRIVGWPLLTSRYGHLSAGNHSAAYQALRRLFVPGDPSYHLTERFHGISFLSDAAIQRLQGGPDMHRELHNLYVSGDKMVIVQLALQGTHLGPLVTPQGTILPTGKRMDAPCCDVFELVDGKIKRFDCYNEASMIFSQLGVLGNLEAALTK